MIFHHITDWDDAYSNGANIAGGNRWPEAWVAPAQAYRDELTAAGRAELGQSYGAKPRNRFDLFLPEGKPKGLVVFIHGGYWYSLDNSYWSHLARGANERGFAVAMPTYTLCPEVRIADIVVEVAAAIETAAAKIEGPIHLTGHSAGGHLVSRMISATSPLKPNVRARIGNTVSISGVHDLRPLMRTKMNANLRIDAEEAQTESPVLLEPGPDARLFCWVGANERAEFIRLNDLLANVWTGLGASTGHYAEPDKHHFNVVDGLADPWHALTCTLLGER
ncbi:alpha/beta hydrolase [Oryzicola mucosus]|uniref:Alpha/beta hydrolase n=1 Tax=Oryzicola mucosus TaxID=2767425 RepID=A0A8J6PPP9_9HYPH|nr:alpha/beta hydrolase [Oryzicola mucosus]MBD0415560.1 alpha/beta hydrolase [Oryzicola mucosus]